MCRKSAHNIMITFYPYIHALQQGVVTGHYLWYENVHLDQLCLRHNYAISSILIMTFVYMSESATIIVTMYHINLSVTNMTV